MARASLGVSPQFLLILACSLWGAATVLNKALLGQVPPVTLLALQLAPGALVLGLATIVAHGKMPRGRSLMAAVALGVLNPGVSYTLSMLGLARIDASISGLLWASEPLMILALAAVILREPITGKLMAVIATGFVGVMLIGGVLGGVPVGMDFIGLGLMVGAVFLCAIYSVYSRRLSADIEPLPLVAVQQSAGLFWALLLLAAIKIGGFETGMSQLTLATIAAAILAGAMYYGLSYWLYVTALQQVPAAVAGAFFNVIPLVTIALSYLFLGEVLSTAQWMGASLIMVSAMALFWLMRRAV